MTVRDLFIRWRDTDLINRKDVKEVVRMFEKDVLPILGHLFVEDVRKGHVTQVTDLLKQRGVNHLARNILKLMRQMFRFAVDRDIIEFDPTASLSVTKTTTKPTERDRILSEFRRMGRTIAKPIKHNITFHLKMTNYRRYRLDGGTYFFTVNLAERQRSLLTERIDSLRDAFRGVKNAHPFVIDAVVVLPEHLHAIWTLPQADDDFSLRWRQIKSAFSRAIEKDERISNSRLRKQERGVWQRRFWEHVIRDEEDFNRHIDYIHINPVKHGYVKRAADWQFSSFHRYVKLGILPADWAGVANDELDLE